jgi:5-methyltetrahydrofolate--homocysteine methyltransferase
MMNPGASVCGLYFAYQDARYFPIGKINKDQVSDYSRRRGKNAKEMEKWLSSNLVY